MLGELPYNHREVARGDREVKNAVPLRLKFFVELLKALFERFIPLVVIKFGAVVKEVL